MIKLKCDCCRNFLALFFDGVPRVLTSSDVSGWYYLYPPGSNEPQLIYHRRDQSKYENYTTTPTKNCRDQTADFVGKASFHYGCVEDLANSMGAGEDRGFAGYNNIPLNGRFKPEVKDLYRQRASLAFMKWKGDFKDELDLQDAVLGRVLYRHVPMSKHVPWQVFGQPFECIWQDLGSYEIPQLESNKTATVQLMYDNQTLNLRTLNFDYLDLNNEFKIIFDRSVIGTIYANYGFEVTVKGREISVKRTDPTFNNVTITINGIDMATATFTTGS